MTATRDTFNERPIYSLSEISKSIERVIAKNYNRAYYIKAEILKLNYYPHSGHCYPELVEKEKGKIKAQLRAIIWSTQFKDINDRFVKITGEPLKEDIGILCLATVEYSAQHGLSLHIQDIEPTFTLGELAKNKQEVIQKLKKENLFNANKLKKLPLLPKRVAIISVETSKGYSDFMVTLNQNHWNYLFECTLFPSILQGDKAIISISHQLEMISKRALDFDCVVIIRGGGGDVGMSCYDDYHLASKVATFPLPVISGIGHSTNETITDMVAFANKITPTEVAYFLIQQFHNFSIQIDDLQNKLVQQTRAILKVQDNFFEQIEHIMQLTVDKWTSRKRKELENQTQLLKLFFNKFLDRQENNLTQAETKIELLHPENVLKRGYSITYFNGKSVKDASQLNKNDIITTRFLKGEINSKVD
jgi:exodeoxyribonuclease VII large subunit